MSPQIRLLTLVLGLVSCATCMVVFTSGDVGNWNSKPNACSVGPSYWCSDISNAKSCRAVKHCIQSVWTKQAVKEDAGDGVCDICKEMVREARDQLMSNETQTELQQVFEGSCNLIPIKMIRTKCVKVFDGFIPELIEMLTSQMNPAVVCTTAGLCNSEWSDRLQAEYRAAQTSELAVSPANKCEDCGRSMNAAIKKLQQKSKEDILNIFSEMCGRMSSYSDGCQSLVIDNIDDIYKFVSRNVTGNDMCNLVGFCAEKPKSVAPRVSVQPKSNDAKFEARLKKSDGRDDLECEFCEALVKHVREILTANTTEEEFKQVLQALCKQTGSFSKQCLSLTSEYYDMIYAFLAQEMDPKQVCQLMTLCPTPGLVGSKGLWYLKVQTAPVLPLSRLFAAEKMKQKDVLVGRDEANAMSKLRGDGQSQLPVELYMPPALTKLTARKSPGCVFCEYVLHQIVDDLHNQTIDKDIEQTMKRVCDRLPSSLSNECDQFVDAYGDALLFLLSQQLDPSVVCSNLQLCTASNDDLVLPVNPFKEPAVKDPNTCALCEFVITELDHRLESEKTEEAVKQALESVCSYLPQSVRKDCTRLVDAYSAQIIEMLLANLTPDEVCAALKFCTPKVIKGMGVKASSDVSVGEFLSKMDVKLVDSDRQSPKVKTVSPATCVMCEMAMAEIDKLLLTNSTEEQIKRTIDFVCGHLPDTVADMCIDFVEEYGDEIFEMLVKEMAPKAVCTQLSLCTAVRASVVRAQPKKVKLLGSDEPHLVDMPGTCQICETVVEYLDKLLEDDTIEESIDRLVEKACRVIPTNAQDKCKGIVDTYGPYLLHQLGMLMDKQKVCQSVHLCKPPPGKVQLLGGEQCTWGPTYWCISTQHADACNTLEHCQTKVWMKSEP